MDGDDTDWGDAPVTPIDDGGVGRDVRALLDVHAWCDRDIPAPETLLGHLLTTTARVFLVGATGLGKTMFALALAGGMASGAGFLSWRTDRPRRVLIVDGEMPGDLIQDRARNVARQYPRPIPPGNLLILGRDLEGEARRLCPHLGEWGPLNSRAGHDFVLALIDATRPEIVVFDNVMSLIDGSQRDEDAWAGATELVMAITARGLAQLWLDHAGHSAGRQYGTSTKAWRFDAVGVMTALDQAGDGAGGADVAFRLSFAPPAGKARRRTPDNRADFADRIIRLVDGQWSEELTEAPNVKPASPTAPARPGRADLDAGSVRRALHRLIAAGRFEMAKAGDGVPSGRAVKGADLTAELRQTGFFDAEADQPDDLGRPLHAVATRGGDLQRKTGEPPLTVNDRSRQRRALQRLEQYGEITQRDGLILLTMGAGGAR